MNKKKVIAWMGSLMILGLGLAYSAEGPQKATRNTFQNTVKSELKKGPLFVDEDGNGICDLADKGKQKGTPNSQNPDRSKQEESKNYQHQNENNASSDQYQKRFSHREENTWNRQSPKQSRENFGNNICDETGPKGRESKKGNGQK